MKSNVIRKKFLDYFTELGHERVASSSLVPVNDPTLLFSNSGMVQFKDIFLGQEQRAYTRATTAQCCLRAGGKHNDLENVGYTARHHTFFEMLGNFSFGDYFKRQAIQFAWKFLTKTLAIPQEKLSVTVYQEDDEAADIWLKEIGISPNRLRRCGKKDNFWSMGDIGPCGPCSEIFYDHGPEIYGGLPGTPEADGDRYVEIWNLVFMQFSRAVDGTLTRLPKPSVDTGMGLERLAAVMQGVHDNYATDLFMPLLQAIGKLANIKDIQQTSARVIADHIRSAVFLLAEGVLPSNEGRGYVLRRIIRRAIRHGSKLGLHDAFFYKLVPIVIQTMGQAYPQLLQAQVQIEVLIKEEEQQFAKTLVQGLRILEQAVVNLSNNIIPGKVIFKLYDTYGFPVDLTGDIARERNLQLDITGFEKAMAKQRQQSQQASKFSIAYNKSLTIEESTDFAGYDILDTEAVVTSLFKDTTPVKQLREGEHGIVVLNRTPFYAESGGQIGDSGVLHKEDGEFLVADTQKSNAAHLHYGLLTKGMLTIGDKLHSIVDAERRQTIRLNHSATHLLHAALRRILGTHVRQQGSLVAAEYLRFDFIHNMPLTTDELHQLELLMNQKIRENIAVTTEIMSFAAAKADGAIALFAEKYADQVRVLSFAEFSKELCGGTHVRRTGDIGLFKITDENGVAAGVRRIEAVTGQYALTYVEDLDMQIRNLAQQLKTPRQTVQEKVLQQSMRLHEMEKAISQLKVKLSSAAANDLSRQAQEVNGVKVLFAKLDNADNETLTTALDQLKNKLGTAIIVLAAANTVNVHLIAGVTKDITNKISAGELINEVASRVGGKGGGRADRARAGGNQPEKLDPAFAAAKAWLVKKLK